MVLSTVDVKRFWAKVNKDGPVPSHCPELGQCWVWTASHGNGYGWVKWQGKRGVRAHRIAFYLEQGRWPIPQCLHRCDNPLCVRHEHLFEGTQQDNSDDMVGKGRSFHPRGEKSNSVKLTVKQVEEIRALYATGEYSQRELAKQFGLASSTSICKIVKKQQWVD